MRAHMQRLHIMRNRDIVSEGGSRETEERFCLPVHPPVCLILSCPAYQHAMFPPPMPLSHRVCARQRITMSPCRPLPHYKRYMREKRGQPLSCCCLFSFSAAAFYDEALSVFQFQPASHGSCCQEDRGAEPAVFTPLCHEMFLLKCFFSSFLPSFSGRCGFQ